jgi:hypothetical protein
VKISRYSGNQYREPSTELERGYEGFAVRFSYTLKKDFPHFEEVAKVWHQGMFPRIHELRLDRTYKGEAQARFDPSFREWNLRYIRLEDGVYDPLWGLG